ncbi:Rmf/CrpP fold protein [Streptomyces sp. LB8]|uniref:Rmf/CrpP fold protein n=1 Tax=Streptomyces sp. LB8 TaxID=3042509 RepID=UPI0026494A47|nr:Rmf/CrpP fold protein [Streptomyces sp. LB8]
MGTREDITRAVSEGRAAGDRGDPPTACPYPGSSLLRTAWIRGYAERRPLASQPDRAEPDTEPDGAD